MDFRLTEEQELLRRTVREFADTEIRPHVREWDREQHFPAELIPALAALGLMGIQFPEEYGGAGMSAIDYCICIEELARVDPAVALSVAAHNGLCASHLFMFGTEPQKQKFLVPLAKGEAIGAWGLTESTSGSDAAGMRTTAVQAGGCWVLNGSKTFTTHGRSGDVLVAMAITDRAAGARGISAFIIEKGTPGMTPGKKEDKLGMRASETSEVLFDNCRVPGDQLLGEEGRGFVDSMQVLDAGRIGIAALAVGLAQGAYEAARDYAFQRKQFGRPIGTFQSIRWKLVDHAVKVEAARLLTYRAAWMVDRGEVGREHAGRLSTSKAFPSEMAERAATNALQILGARGYSTHHPIERAYRDAKQLQIVEGTNQVQRLIMGRAVEAGDFGFGGWHGVPEPKP
jgi:butyryl-CoA dehydrogenase